MILRRSSSTPRNAGTSEYVVVVDFDREEARQVMSKKDLFALEGIPLDPSVNLAGVVVRIDTPLPLAGMMIADEDTTARFTCTEDQYAAVLPALDAWLRSKLVGVSLK